MYSIGELSRLSGVPVRKIRFYSDKGLLPPLTRTEGNYRVFSNTDVARLDLIRALRDADISLEMIQKALSRRLPLAEVLKLRLEALEVEIASRHRVAAVLRAVLRAPEPSEHDLRRLWKVTRMSNEQFGSVVKSFYERLTESGNIDQEWKQQLIQIATPNLPDHPTPPQIDAWIELVSLLADKRLDPDLEADMAEMWNDSFDPATYKQASDDTFFKVEKAIADGVAPSSETALAIAQEWLARSAAAMGRRPDHQFLQWHLDQFDRHHERSARYQKLMAILNGSADEMPAGMEWVWINQALSALKETL